MTEGNLILKTLTESSIVEAGKYKGQRVSSIMHDINYISYVYFRLEKVTYCEDVLNKVIPLKYRIPKPGTSKEMHKQFNVDRFNLLTQEEKTNINFTKKIDTIKHAHFLKNRLRNADHHATCKASLKNINQGKTHLDLNHTKP